MISSFFSWSWINSLEITVQMCLLLVGWDHVLRSTWYAIIKSEAGIRSTYVVVLSRGRFFELYLPRNDLGTTAKRTEEPQQQMRTESSSREIYHFSCCYFKWNPSLSSISYLELANCANSSFQVFDTNMNVCNRDSSAQRILGIKRVRKNHYLEMTARFLSCAHGYIEAPCIALRRALICMTSLRRRRPHSNILHVSNSYWTNKNEKAGIVSRQVAFLSSHWSLVLSRETVGGARVAELFTRSKIKIRSN